MKLASTDSGNSSTGLSSSYYAVDFCTFFIWMGLLCEDDRLEESSDCFTIGDTDGSDLVKRRELDVLIQVPS